jgi:indole-3-glycerol phosphate synthase
MEEYQLLQAAAYGADAVLLIVALLDGQALPSLVSRAKKLGLTPLVEVHDEEELKTALSLNCEWIGVNNRNLKTMEISLTTSEKLIHLKERNSTFISESGLKTGADLKRLQSLGYRGFLIGTSFMKSGRPGKALERLLGEVR